MTFKPHCAPNEHWLWADITSFTSPLRLYHKYILYEDISVGLYHTRELLDANTVHHNVMGMHGKGGFLDKCQRKWDLSFRVAGMFARPNGVLLS